MPNTWLVTIDNLDNQAFDDFLETFLDGEEYETGGIGLSHESMSPATTAILVSGVSSRKLLDYVKSKLDPNVGRATVAKLSGGNKNIGKVWDIDMDAGGNWQSH